MPPRVIWGGYVGVASYILAEAAAPSRDEKKRSELGGHGTNCRLASNPETLEEDIREKEVEELREGRLHRERTRSDPSSQQVFVESAAVPRPRARRPPGRRGRRR